MPQSDYQISQAIIQEEMDEQARIETQIRNSGSIFTNGNMGTSNAAKGWMEVNRGDAFVNIVELLQKYGKSLKKSIHIDRGLRSGIEDLNMRVDAIINRINDVSTDIAIDKSAIGKRCVALEKRCHELEKKNKYSAKGVKTKKNKINIFSNTVLKLETTIQELKDKIKDLEASQADLESDQGELMGDIIKLQKGEAVVKSGSKKNRTGSKKRTHKKR